MKFIVSLALIASLAFAASANAQSNDNAFYATAGVANLDSSVSNASSDTQGTVGIGYKFTKRASVELTAPVGSFDTDLSYPAGTLIEAQYRPYTLSVTYNLLPNSKFQPYVGAGYTYLDTNAKAVGLISGTALSAKSDRSFSARIGADYNFNNNWFIRGDVTAITQTKLVVDVAGGIAPIVNESSDPTIYSLSAGFRF